MQLPIGAIFKFKKPFSEANMWFCSITFVFSVYIYCFSLKDHLKTGSKDSASLNQMLHSPALVSINQKKSIRTGKKNVCVMQCYQL